MVAILLSLIMELLIKEIGRICMPSKYKDQHLISAFFKKIGSKSKKENINDRI
jgi:hypothetical protein